MTMLITVAYMSLRLKVILHFKMKILSSYTHPHVVSNPYEFLSSAEQEGRYLEECQ